MVARVTDDYERMALAGVEAVVEPAFWLGSPRTSVGTFIDYFEVDHRLGNATRQDVRPRPFHLHRP